MREVPLKEIVDKLQELIIKHNELAKTVVDLLAAVEAINEAVFSKGEVPKTLDS